MKRESSSPAELHRRAREVFLQARERPGTDRERYLRESCGEDEVLRGEVESLLSFDGAEGSPVDRPFLGAEFVLPEAPELCSDVPTENPESGDMPSRPEHIGRYTVVDEIGRGGMGIVYLAEQPLTERRVAIKILNRSSPRRLQRFELEAQILGFLKHPGIAQIYEAGTTDLGTGRQVFFAMEFVEGPPITDFAAQRRLSIPERVELLARVCDGVQHAHDRGVLHLDLKPDNVLVDESGAPKVLDFGVARFEEAVGELGRADQEPGHVIGTPAYMSPEQWAGASDELDARSDVFSLGMVAHELLTGELPVKSDPRSSARKLGRELEAILCRALADSPQERYATAAELAADLRRFLAYEPLRAREAKPLYLLQKFAQRRRALTLALSGLFLMLVSGIIVSTTLTLEAQRQAGRKEKLIEFLHEILMSPNPMQSGSDVTVLEVLADSEELIRRQLAGEPEVEAEVRLTLGMLYRRLGDTKNAEPHLRNAVELFRRTRSEGELRALRAKLELASLLVLYLEDLDEAELLIQDVLAVEEGGTPESRLNRIRALSMTASIHRERGEFEQAISAYERAEVLARVLATPDDVLELSLRSFRARALAEGERFEEAQELARATLDEKFRRLGAEHRQTLISQVTLGSILLRRWQAGVSPGQLGEAEALLRGAFEGRITRLGPEHPGTLSAQQLLSEALQERGLMKEAIALQREVVEVYGRSLGLSRADAVQASLRLQSMLDGPLAVEEAVSGADGDL